MKIENKDLIKTFTELSLNTDIKSNNRIIFFNGFYLSQNGDIFFYDLDGEKYTSKFNKKDFKKMMNLDKISKLKFIDKNNKQI